MWRVITGRHHNIGFSSMEAGHTKFSPDWHFGLLKWPQHPLTCTRHRAACHFSFKSFKLYASNPGIVTVREYFSSQEKEVNSMKRGQAVNIDRNTMPAALTPKGLERRARQWYLYQEIRPFCKDTSDTLQSCPKSLCPKPSVKVEP